MKFRILVPSTSGTKADYYYKVMTRASRLRLPSATQATLSVLLELVKRHNCTVYVTGAQVSDEIQRPRRTVYKALDQLKELNLIKDMGDKND